jgi:hypothetical protein
MEVLYHIRPYFVGIFPYIGHILKFPLIYSMNIPLYHHKMVAWSPPNISGSGAQWNFAFLCDHSRCLWHPWAAHILVLWPWTTVRWYWWFRSLFIFPICHGDEACNCNRSTCNCNRSTMSLEVDMNSQLVVSLTVWIGEPSLAHLCGSEIPTQILDLFVG